MNQIRIEEGIIVDIKPSHTLADTQYDQMQVVVKNSNGKESLIILKYKRYDNKFYEVGSRVNCSGTLRSYSEKIGSKSKVTIYVDTDFSQDDSQFMPDVTLYPSSVIIDGIICSMEPLRELSSGKCNIHFILANNVQCAQKSYNSYIPCIAWGSNARFCENLEVGQSVKIYGRIQSRQYEKKLDDGTSEIRRAYEVSVSKMELEKESKPADEATDSDNKINNDEEQIG